MTIMAWSVGVTDVGVEGGRVGAPTLPVRNGGQGMLGPRTRVGHRRRRLDLAADQALDDDRFWEELIGGLGSRRSRWSRPSR